MDANDLSQLSEIAQNGQSIALLVCVWFIKKCSERLARIETRLAIALKDDGDDHAE